eukprot:6001709-Prymnesium_polylepis.1
MASNIQRIGHYRLGKNLGIGSFGKVRCARSRPAHLHSRRGGHSERHNQPSGREGDGRWVMQGTAGRGWMSHTPASQLMPAWNARLGPAMLYALLASFLLRSDRCRGFGTAQWRSISSRATRWPSRSSTEIGSDSSTWTR